MVGKENHTYGEYCVCGKRIFGYMFKMCARFAASVTVKITIGGVCMGCTPSIANSKRSYSTCVLVAQSVEHLTFNQVVEGSIPSKHICRICYGIKSYIEMHQHVTMYSFQILIFTLDTVYLLTLYLYFIKKKNN